MNVSILFHCPDLLLLLSLFFNLANLMHFKLCWFRIFFIDNQINVSRFLETFLIVSNYSNGICNPISCSRHQNRVKTSLQFLMFLFFSMMPLSSSLITRSRRGLLSPRPPATSPNRRVETSERYIQKVKFYPC